MSDCLECPFCGLVPDGNDPKWFTQEVRPKWGRIVCCIEGPEARAGYGQWHEWKDDAIAAWNKRVVPSTTRFAFSARPAHDDTADKGE